MATIKICSCGEHGRIIIEKKKARLEFCFKVQAEILIRYTIEHAFISEREAEDLHQQLSQFDLPEEYFDVPKSRIDSVNQINFRFLDEYPSSFSIDDDKIHNLFEGRTGWLH